MLPDRTVPLTRSVGAPASGSSSTLLLMLPLEAEAWSSRTAQPLGTIRSTESEPALSSTATSRCRHSAWVKSILTDPELHSAEMREGTRQKPVFRREPDLVLR